MPDNSIIDGAKEPEAAKVVFPEQARVRPCSANVCANGHEWQPRVALAPCGGCNSPILAVKMEQCPICNEPVARMRLRTDHFPTGGAVSKLCRGEQSVAEVGEIVIERNHTEAAENAPEGTEPAVKVVRGEA